MDEKWAAAVKERWNVELPRTKDKLLKVYNGGFMLFSKNGMKQAKETFVDINEYIKYISSKGIHKLYTRDQNYLHAMIFVTKIPFQEMDTNWNSFMHYLGDSKMKVRPVNDMRTPKTKLVHIQLRGADDYDEKTLWELTNLPVDQWSIRKK
jgi:hypothetical protein